MIEEQKVEPQTEKPTIKPQIEKPTFGISYFLLYVLHRFFNDSMPQRASVLTISSLMVSVPLCTVLFSFFTSFGIFFELKTKLQNFVFANFVPRTANILQKYIDVSTTPTIALTLLGILFLLFLSIILLMNISNTFNTIWKVRNIKSGLSRFLVYWATLTLAPILFGTSVLINHYMLYMSPNQAPWVQITLQNVSFILSFALQVLGFTILYLVVPHFPVQRRNALLGGILTGFLFEVLREIFIIYFTIFPPLENIYTMCAVLPIVILWIYLIWISVLFGAEITAALPEWCAVSKNQAFASSSPSPKMLLFSVLSVLHTLLKGTMSGKGYVNNDLLEETGITPNMLIYATKELERLNFITRSDYGHWVLSRELKGIKLYDLYAYLNLSISKEELDYSFESGWFNQFDQTTIDLEQAAQTVMNLDLKDMLWDENIDAFITTLKQHNDKSKKLFSFFY